MRPSNLLAVVVGLFVLASSTLLPAMAADPAPGVQIEKRVKAKKLEKTLAGSWQIYPAPHDDSFDSFLVSMASVPGLSVDDIMERYRLPDESRARLEAIKADNPPAPPPEMAAMFEKGIVMTFKADGTMRGSMGPESKDGTWTVVERADNVLTVKLEPAGNVFDITFVDKNRLILAKHGDPQQVAGARTR